MVGFTRIARAVVVVVMTAALLPLGALPAHAATPIMGTQVITSAELAGWFASTGRKPHPNLGISIRDLAGHFVREGRAERVRGDIAFAQSIVETGYFSFPAHGQVRPRDYNYAGIGAVDGGNSPNRFPSPKIGVRAQIQHLRAYADPTVTEENLAYPLVDPRFKYVTPKGKAPTWEQLSGTWASDREYGRKILTVYASILKYSDARRNAIPLSGDWNGDGRSTPGWFKDGFVFLRNRNSGGSSDLFFRFGRAGDVPVVGDWDGDGQDTIGVRRGRTWLLRNKHSGGRPHLRFDFGAAGARPVVGDWNGDETDTVGVRRGSTWRLRNRNSAGRAHRVFDYGRASDVPVVGDWNSNGADSIGVRRGATWRLRNRNSAGRANAVFDFGRATDRPLTGDWNLNGQDSAGVVRGTRWLLRFPLSAGPANRAFTYQR